MKHGESARTQNKSSLQLSDSEEDSESARKPLSCKSFAIAEIISRIIFSSQSLGECSKIIQTTARWME